MIETWIILWLGCTDWEDFAGPLEQAIAYVKANGRYKDYGHTGARILRREPVYEIKVETVERTFSHG